MKGKIRVCTLDDLDKLQEISIETFSDSFAVQNDPTDLEEYLVSAYAIEKLKQELENSDSHFSFIYLADELAGYLKLNTGAAQTEQIAMNGLEVERIYIRKEFKRCGLGRQLIDFAINHARKDNRELIWLGVWEKNEQALSFYQTFGFKEIGKHTFYVGRDQQTDLILVKKLIY